ncbi:trypco2 family protein [Streptomyces sp. NPDC088116]|uniref:trypco2 family protein n=1 Tax=Streptomyces sp. NPDC088116 TaxID=3365825 RepID=UPI0037FF43E6
MELTEMIRELRAQLTAASAEGASEPLQFELGPIEVEVNVAVSKEMGGSGRVRFMVVEAGSDGKYARSETQRITITLQPTTRGPDGTRMSAHISGAAMDRER